MIHRSPATRALVTDTPSNIASCSTTSRVAPAMQAFAIDQDAVGNATPGTLGGGLRPAPAVALPRPDTGSHGSTARQGVGDGWEVNRWNPNGGNYGVWRRNEPFLK